MSDSETETDPAAAGQELKDPDELGDFDDYENEKLETLHATHVRDHIWVVVNEAKQTWYRVDLERLWKDKDDRTPCECEDSVYQQDPSANECCKHVTAVLVERTRLNDLHGPTIRDIRDTVEGLQQSVTALTSNVAGLEGVIQSATAHEGTPDPSGSQPTQTDTGGSQSDLSDDEAEDMVREYLAEWVAPKLMEHVTVTARECETDDGSFYGVAVETEYVDDDSTREKLNSQVRDAFDGDGQVAYTGPAGEPEYANVMNMANVRRVTDNA